MLFVFDVISNKLYEMNQHRIKKVFTECKQYLILNIVLYLCISNSLREYFIYS